MESPYATALLNLDPSSPQFRLLELHPRTSNSTITCTLSSHSFDGCHPTYKALSYTWGPKEKPHPILLNGIEFYVGHSLWTFLGEMCLQGQYGVYWIDAICIDQDSILEKNHQVQMMKCIYSTAEEVVVWLGEADHIDLSDTAMDLLAGPSSWVETNSVLSDWLYGRISMAVRKILNRDYWSRIWIIQETMVAKRISVYCGSKRLEWQALREFMIYLATTPPEADKRHRWKVHSLYATMGMRLVYDKEQVRTTQKKSTLAELLSYYKFCEASNVLDKVYALCGLASDADHVVIDYDISPRDLVVHLLDAAPRDQSEHKFRQFAWAAYEALGLDFQDHNFKDLFESFLISERKRRCSTGTGLFRQASP